MIYVIALLVLGFLILIHELGHFVAARLNDVMIEEFSIGMGPKIAGIKGKETQYSIRAFPIGGYVKMLGDEEKSADPRAFNNKSSLRRLSIVSAGPIMNIVLAVILYCVVGGYRGIELPMVDKVVANSPAQTVGVQSGDKIIKVDDYSVLTWDDFAVGVSLAKGNTINLSVKRNGEIKSFSIKPKLDKEENRYMVGIYSKVITSPNVLQSIDYGSKETISMIKQAILSFKLLFTGKASANDVGGPVTIVRITGAAAQAGIIPLLTMTAFISSQLGILNLLPIPALDGGYVFLFLFQIITGKKVDDDKIGVVTTIGFTILMALMVVVVLKDILYPIKF